MSKVKVPKRLKVRPQYKGLPIPYVALILPDGEPDFRVIDHEKRFSVIVNHWCQLCGEPLGLYCFFVGGPAAAAANQYFEPATHLDCLIYAMQTCPFIVGKLQHADLEKVQEEYKDPIKLARPGYAEGKLTMKIDVSADETFTVVKSDWWVIKKATGWRVARTTQGTLLLLPDAVKQTKPLHPMTMSAAEWKSVMKWLSE